jgi:hypothetical protein
MKQRAIAIAVAAALAAAALPAAASADGSSPFTLGVGTFIPTSPSSSFESLSPVPGTSIHQHGDIGLEVSFGRGLIPGGYQITAMVLSQRQTGSYLVFAPGPITISADETLTQVPVMFEGGGTQVGPVRFGAGLGYDFVSGSKITGSSKSANGLIGDTFVDIGLGSSGAALDAKYFFGQRAALSGVYVGVKTRL